VRTHPSGQDPIVVTYRRIESKIPQETVQRPLVRVHIVFREALPAPATMHGNCRREPGTATWASRSPWLQHRDAVTTPCDCLLQSARRDCEISAIATISSIGCALLPPIPIDRPNSNFHAVSGGLHDTCLSLARWSSLDGTEQHSPHRIEVVREPRRPPSTD
jgi:hypothetical protein